MRWPKNLWSKRGKAWAVAVAVVVLTGSAAFGLTRPAPQRTLKKVSEPSLTGTSTPHPSSSASAPVVSTSAAASVSVSPKVAQKPAASVVSPTSAPSAPSSTPAPFQITLVRVDSPSWYCAGGYSLYASASSIVNANSTAGGTFSWQVETTTPSVVSTAVVEAFPAGQPFYFGSSVDHKGPYFSGPVTAGESIRYQVSGPNTIMSAWYTIPADAKC